MLWCGALATALLAYSGGKLLLGDGAQCTDSYREYADRRGRWVMVKSRHCE
jgi:hypothetical protein